MSIVIQCSMVAALMPQENHKGLSLIGNGKHELFLQRKVSEAQPADVVSGGSSYRNWFQRIGDSIGNFLASPFMLCLAISVMWLNERRNARMHTLISKGRSDVV